MPVLNLSRTSEDYGRIFMVISHNARHEGYIPCQTPSYRGRLTALSSATGGIRLLPCGTGLHSSHNSPLSRLPRRHCICDNSPCVRIWRVSRPTMRPHHNRNNPCWPNFVQPRRTMAATLSPSTRCNCLPPTHCHRLPPATGGSSPSRRGICNESPSPCRRS